MKSKFAICMLSVALMGMLVTACKDDDKAPMSEDETQASAVMVTSFALGVDDEVVANLDSVHFTIDLVNAQIFNADSLPYGTSTRRFVLNIGMSTVSKAQIIMPNYDGSADTTVNYLTNSTDSINFTRGQVTLHLESFNREVKRDYTIKVNVHKMIPDSLAWGDVAYCSLPTNLSTIVAQKTVKYKDQAVCFTSDGLAANVAVAANPVDNDWTITTATLPVGAVVNSITATDDALYLVTDAQALYRSTDTGASWTDTGVQMSHIYGGYGTSVVGVRKDASGKYYHNTYPETSETLVPDDCPVAETGSPLLYTTKWATTPMLMVIGGVTASGETVDGVWSYDNGQWLGTTISGIVAAKGMKMVPSYQFATNDNWSVTEFSVLLAWGGEMADGTINDKVYVSRDRGVHWHVGDSYVQLPAYIAPTVGGDLLVFEKTMKSRSAASSWINMPVRNLPTWCLASRAITPITEWECPYIYMFGGVKADGSLSQEVWRGVVNRMMFQPLQ